LAALCTSSRRQPSTQGITSSTEARLADAEGCTSHPAAGQARGPSLVIKKARLLFEILSYSKRQQATVLLPGEDRKLLLSCLSFIFFFSLKKQRLTAGAQRQQDVAQTAGS